MGNAIIFQVGGVVLFLFFCFLTYLNTKSWRALHVTFTFLCFAAAIAFAVYSAMVMKTRSNWQKFYTQAEKNLGQAEEKLQLVTDGNRADVPQKADNIRVMKEEVGRILLDRGRVWRECRPTNAAPDSVTVSTAPASLPEGVAPAPNKIEEKLILYAFKEITSADGIKVPGIFLGSFRVTAATPDTVTMAPLIPLDGQQMQHLNDREATWALYELMPIDDYEAFAGLTDDQIKALFPPELVGPVAPQRAEAMVNRYLRTGKAANENDSPYEVWLRVKFLKEHTVEVDSPDAPAAALDTGFFDPQGRAVVQRLKRGENKIAAGETTLLFREKEGEQLIADGTAELIERVYMRPLNDYNYKFTETFTEVTAINHRMVEVKRDLDTLTAAEKKAQTQIAYRTDEKKKLEADLSQAQNESSELTKYLAMLEQRNSSLRSELSTLYKQNRALAAELTSINARLTDQINTRTAKAAE